MSQLPPLRVVWVPETLCLGASLIWSVGVALLVPWSEQQVTVRC